MPGRHIHAPEPHGTWHYSSQTHPGHRLRNRVPPKEVMAFEEEMRRGGVDWQLIAYGGAVHAFTDWGAGNDNSKGVAYNERADRRSWEAMKQFVAETFK